MTHLLLGGGARRQCFGGLGYVASFVESGFEETASSALAAALRCTVPDAVSFLSTSFAAAVGFD